MRKQAFYPVGVKKKDAIAVTLNEENRAAQLGHELCYKVENSLSERCSRTG